jgi:putative endopeptidase
MRRMLRHAGLLLLTACSAGTTSQVSSHPQYGSWGVDLAGQDTAIRAGDDFFGRVNGGWVSRATIPGDKPGTTLRLLMTDTTEARLHAIMEAAAAKAAHEPTDLEGKVGAYYKAFMDSAAIEKLGAAPLKAHLDQVRAATTPAAIAALMGRNNFDFNGTAFGIYVDVDLKDPNIYSVYVNQAGLGLPDRDYYLKPSFMAQRDAYKRYVESLLKLIDWPDPTARAQEILAFETLIADVSWTKVQQRDPNAVYNPMTVAELSRFAPGFDWSGYLGGAAMPRVTKVIVGEKSAFPKIAEIVARTPISVLQAWQAFTIADNAAPFLSEAFGGAYFGMRLKTLAGQQTPAVRWKQAVHAVSGGDYLTGERTDRFGNIGFGVGELFTAKYFPPAAKAKIEGLIVNLKAAYRLRIEKLDWMSAPTRQKALKKLDTYTIKVGYPDKSRDYTKLVVRDDDLLGDVQRSAAIDWQFYVDRSGGPVDKSDWAMTPQTNDAYNGSLRDIVFPAGILQPPIFDPNADPAINYGAAGGIIGHELTHGFDDQGRRIDADGTLRDWWQPADSKTFDVRAKAFAAQYSAFEPLPGVHINGDLTLGENIADLGGVTLALDAYRASLKGQAPPVLDGFTGDQRVFLGWAHAWRGKMSDDYIKKQVATDPHSPRRFRVNGPLRNIDAWYEAFGIEAGDKLYLPPERRVRIW